MAARHGHQIPDAPRRGRRTDYLRQAAPADAAAPLVLRIQSRQLRAATSHQPGAVCLRSGTGNRSGKAAPRTAGTFRAVRPAASVKLAFVVQRYGADIAGGSEMHCRQLAERLSPRHDVTVLTTCARDYVTWENAYPPGVSMEGGVRVQRFPVARTRNLKTFADLSDE